MIKLAKLYTTTEQNCTESWVPFSVYDRRRKSVRERGVKFLIKSSQDDISQICTRHTTTEIREEEKVDEDRQLEALFAMAKH